MSQGVSDVLHLELFEAVGHDTELLLHGGHHLVAVGMMRRWMVAHLVPVLPRADGGVYGVHQAVLGGNTELLQYQILQGASPHWTHENVGLVPGPL